MGPFSFKFDPPQSNYFLSEVRLESLGQSFVQTGLTDLAVRLALGPIWWAPKIGLRDRLMDFVKDKLLNVETVCSPA